MKKKKTVDMFAAFIGDGYLYGATDDPRGGAPRYWLSLRLDNEPHEIYKLKNVPIELAEKLSNQGTQSQDFDDGYDAANAAAPYVAKRPLHVYEVGK